MRYRSLALIAVVALVASSCSADPGGGSPATPAGEDPSAGSAVAGGLSVDQQELTDAMRLLMLRDEQLSAEFTDDQIGCLSEGLAGAFSDVRRDELQLDASSLIASHNDRASFALGVAYEMTDDETLDVVARASKCVDWRPAAAEDLVDAGVPPTEAECIASELPDPGIESMVMRTLMIGSTESAPGFGLTDDESFEATGPCIDVEGTFLDLLIGEAGISEHGARCLADGLPDWVFDTELDVDEDTDEDAEEPSIEDLTELETHCLSPGELQSLSAASLDDAASSAIPLEPPAPTELETVAQESVGPSGGVVAHDGVVISVPSGALSELAEVIIREPLGEFGSEVGGAVVEVEHLNPVQVPITVTWDVSHLSDTEQRGILLVHWDDDLEDWVPRDVDYEIRDGVLTAAIQEWCCWGWAKEQGKKLVSGVVSGGKKLVSGGKALASEINNAGAKAWNGLKKGPSWAKKKFENAWTSTQQWADRAWISATDKLADLSQSVQQFFGRRVAAPRCSDDPLPDWVEDTLDAGISAAAVRVCYESRDGQSIRMRVANNRTFTQIIRTDADEGWTPSPLLATPEISVEFIVQTIAHKLFSNDERLFLPSLKESHVTIERPSSGDLFQFIQFRNTHDPLTFLFDIVIFALSYLPDERLPSRLQLMFEVFFECGVKQLGSFSTSYDDLADIGRAAVNTMKSCAQNIIDPKSELGKEVRTRMALASNMSEQEVTDYFKNNRNVGYFSQALKALKVAEGIGVLIDLGAELLVGTLHWGVRVQGRTASLGDWDPTCSDIAVDSNRLFQNLVFQDVFGGSKEVHEVHLFGAWKRSSARAVSPLSACDFGHRSAVAEDVLTWYLDSEATRIVRDHILALSSSPSSSQLSYIAIAAGGGHVCGIRIGGTVECWGDNAYGQADAPSGQFSMISADWDHSCGIRSDGTVECWGNNASGQADPPSGRFVAISDGGYHSCGLRDDSSVECWGRSAFGRIDAPSGRFAAVSAGGDHSCGIRDGGAVECWGYDGLGQIDAPANQFMEVSSGWSHSCGIRSNGTVQCWGDNSVGRTDAPSGQFTAISAGSEHSCGIRGDGTVECWGDNSFGRTDAPSGRFTAISAGLDQSCGIRDDGAVECWGYDGDR